MKKRVGLYVRIFVLVSFMLMNGYGCGGGGGGGDSSGTGDQSGDLSGVFYDNPTDARVLTVADDSDGSTYTYNGRIDENGEVTAFTSVVVEDPEIEGDLTYVLDDEGFPTTIHALDAIFELEQISSTALRLTALSIDGEFRVSIPLELSEGAQSSASAAHSAANSDISALDATQASAANMQVTLTKCGKPVENALITASLNPKIGTSVPVGTHVGGGTYDFFIPATVDPKLDKLKKCDEVESKIQSFCLINLFTRIQDTKSCQELHESAAKLTNKLGGSKYLDTVDKLCPILFKHLPKIVSTLCGNTGDGTTAEYIKDLCRWEVITAEPEETHTFTLSIQIPGSEGFDTEPVSFSPNVPSRWEMPAPTEIALEKFTVVPSNPESKDWYTAHASMVCPDPDNGTTVTLSVIGSDNHTGATEEVMTTNSSLSLDIPPAMDPEEPLTDTITVTAEGKTWTMVVHRGGDENYVETQKYHVFKRSGTGYRKKWSGYEDKHTGFDYFYLYILPSEANEAIANSSKFDEFTANACASASPALCPCPTYPDIWESGTVELVGVFDTAEEMDPYRCDTYQFDPGNIICTQWEIVSEQNGWENINAICGE